MSDRKATSESFSASAGYSVLAAAGVCSAVGITSHDGPLVRKISGPFLCTPGAPPARIAR